MSASRSIGHYSEQIGEIRKKKLYKKWLKDCKNKIAREIARFGLIDAKTKTIGNEYFLWAKYPETRQAYYNSWKFEDYLIHNGLKSSGLVRQRESFREVLRRFFILWLLFIVGIFGGAVLICLLAPMIKH